jgi:DNA-binding beta-propeller fold protein YncE
MNTTTAGKSALLVIVLFACASCAGIFADEEEPEDPAAPMIDPGAALPGGAEARLLPPKSAPKAVAFSYDGKMVAVACADKTVRVFGVPSAKLLSVLEGHEGAVLDVAFSPDGKYAASCGEDNTIRLWDLKTFKQVRTFEGHTQPVKGVCFSPDGSYLVSASADVTLKVWDVETGRARYTLEGHSAHVDRVTWSRDGATILSEAADSTAHLWDGARGLDIRPLPERDGEVAAVAISPDGRYGITTRGDHSWHVFETSSGEDALILRGQNGNGACAAFSADSRSVFTGGLDGSIRQWDLASGLEIRRMVESGPRMVALAVDPTGKRLITVSQDGNTLLWAAHAQPANPAGEDPKPAYSQPEYLPKNWLMLASPDYNTRASAVLRFLNSGQEGVRFIEEKMLASSTALDAAHRKELIDKLDDASYGIREAAMKEIAALGPSALPMLQDALEHSSVEVRIRVQALLHTSAAQETLRETLALEVLGWMKVPAARELLAKFAKGPACMPNTMLAKAILERPAEAKAKLSEK